jgi:hypothetical protein
MRRSLVADIGTVDSREVGAKVASILTRSGDFGGAYTFGYGLHRQRPEEEPLPGFRVYFSRRDHRIPLNAERATLRAVCAGIIMAFAWDGVINPEHQHKG